MSKHLRSLFTGHKNYMARRAVASPSVSNRRFALWVIGVLAWLAACAVVASL